MRILSDFDGVFTHQDAEAAAVGERLEERVIEALGGDAPRARAMLSSLRNQVHAKPAEHGWFVGDEIGCYADEDPYVFNNAVARAIYVHGPAELRDAIIASGFPTFDAFSSACFVEGTERWRASNKSHVLPEALAAMQTFFSAGFEVVVVSNSSTGRISAILEQTGILRWGTGKIRVRGDARKFHVTGDRPSSIAASADFGGRKVLLRRGSYWDILNEERPDVVIGDVLSLDIALPATLREKVADFEEMDVVLNRHPYTPKWAIDGCAAKGVKVVDSIGKLPELLRV